MGPVDTDEPYPQNPEPFIQPLTRPAFCDLPLRPEHPKASAWGLYGPGDELGTLNLITPETILEARNEIRIGRTVTLNLPLNVPLEPMNPARRPCQHTFIAKAIANDDEININTQSSTQWDGLRHYPYQNPASDRRFYNGVRQADLHNGTTATETMGIQNTAQKGIVGRGVLLDWADYAKRKGIEYDPFESYAIPLPDLLEIAEDENIEWQKGDILFIRSGWTAAYNQLSDDRKRTLARRGDKKRFIGVEASREMMEWHWDRQFAAVAGDTNAYEVWPPTKPWGVSCHEVFLSGWGMSTGELFDLEDLSETCRELGRWTFFLSSVPLNLPGGVGSPANAVAIF